MQKKIWEACEDLQKAFPEVQKGDERRYMDWWKIYWEGEKQGRLAKLQEYESKQQQEQKPEPAPEPVSAENTQTEEPKKKKSRKKRAP